MRRPDSETIANIFSRAYAETGSIADAFWATEAVVRRGPTHDIGAAGLNREVEAVAKAHGLKPSVLLGRGRSEREAAARFECWWRLRQRQPPLSAEAIGIAFNRHRTVVMDGVRRFEAMLSERAELRARLAWEAAAERREAA
jgi:hypothetical protein